MKAINYTYITFFSVVSILSSFPLLINPPLASAQSLSPITPAIDGTGTIVHPQGDRWQIEGGSYNSDRTNLFHSFQRFNVPNGQTANFLATPQLKNILGRVTGGEASFINGLIQVTGGKANLFLMNPAGMIFGPNASLNIPAAFTATTATGMGFANIWWQGIGTNNYENLLGSPHSFAFSLSQAGAIVNQANLAVNPGESINLFGGVVVNTGNLTATGGNITLTAVAGEQILRIAQNGHLLNLEVAPLGTVGQIPLGENITPLTLPALLTGNSQDHATTISVNNLGQVVLANHVLIPTQSGTVITAGKINVANPQGEGGNVNIFGDRTAVINSTINANGKDGGGTILIGGDWQGQGKFNAQQTFVNEQSVIKANAEDRGNGGKVVIWSDDTTKFAGEITATGGKQAGDGGLVEISGKQDLVFRGKVDVGAINGQIGNILFDPENIVIDVADPLAVDDDYTLTIDANNINQLTGVINLQADNDITINRAIATDQAVTLAAGRSININADIDTVAGNGNINLLANNDDANLNNRQTGAANIQMLDGTSLKAGSGNITLQLGNLGAVGNISLANLVSTGTVTIDGNRGNILPTSANSLITANNLSLNTGNNAGIGLIDTPLKIEVNNLEAIAGSKGIFINATKPLNIGSIDGTNLGLKTEKKGNINLTVTGDLTLTDHVTTATDDQTAAGNISLTSTGNINGTTSLISTNSFDGTAGNIKLTATGDINTAKIQANAGQVNFIDEDYRSEGGSGKAGNITLQAGGAIKTNDISAYAVLGNSGTINLTAEQAITITKLQNFAGYNSINTGESVGKGDSGKINLISKNAGISTGKIESFAGSGSPGDLIINADNNIAIAGIDSFTNGDGDGALINITSKNGAINIKNPLELSVGEGLGSMVNMTAHRNINMTGINANTNRKKAGNLTITSNQGAINISGDLNFSSLNSNGGQVLLKANQDIKTAGINTKSEENGNAGHIQLISETGNINTTGKLDAIAKGIGGNVDLQAKGNINISGINTSGINTIGGTASGNINITSESGIVNTTQGFLNSYSEAGTPGDITIKASGDITTGYLTALSLAADKGGIVNITSNTGKIDTTQGTIETWSKAGTGNQVTLQAAGNINLGNIDSHGLRGGGAVNITSQQGAVTMNLADTTINSSATQGIPGNVNITGNSLVTVRAINAGGKNILGDVNLTSETNDVIFNLNDITGNLIVNTPNGNIDLTGPQNIKIVDGENGDPFTTKPIKNINSDADQINNKPAKKVNLQAHNDITLNEAIKTNQQIKELNMQAGRNIKVNADIDTSAGNGNINLLANQADQNNIYRQTGAGNIIMADGTTLKAGKGNINLALGGTEQIGNITLANLQTAGNIQVNALGGNIFASSNNAVINGNQLTLQTAGVGGIGKIDLPLRLQVNVLEANAGSRGVFLKSLQGLTIGSDNLPLSGITTSGGQIQVIAEQGDILIQEPLTTAGDNQNAGNITMKSLAGNISSVADINSQAISTQEANSTNTRSTSTIINAGDVTLEAAGNITTSNIISSATGNNNSGDISLTAGQSIDTILGKLSAESVDGLAGKINLTAFGDINTGEIFSQATGLGSGGNILINSTNGNVQTNGQISSKTLSGKESGDITISADGDLSIQEKVHSLSEGTGQAGNINIISKQGTITSEQSIESSSNTQAGNITLQAEGDITIDQLNSRGKLPDANAGIIIITSEAGNIIANQGLYSDSNGGIGANITLNALAGAVKTQDIRTFSKDKNNTIGTGGDVNITAGDAININQDIESIGLDKSGDVIIRSASGMINTKSILTRADNGISGDIQLNTYSQQGDIQTANLTTIGNQAAGQVAVIAADGNIITKDLTSQSDQGSSDGINIDGNDITTGDQTVISATGDSTITNTAKGSLFVGNQRAIADQGDANITNQAGDNITTGDQTAITNTGDVSLINQAGGNINVGDQTAITNTGNVTIANTATNITTGNQTAITNTGNVLINNIATGNINIGNQTAITNNGNALINNNAGGNLSTGEQRAIAPGGINQVINTEGGQISTRNITEGNISQTVNNNFNIGNNPNINPNPVANNTNSPVPVAVNTISKPVINITNPDVSILPINNNFNSNIVNNLPTAANNIVRTENNPLVNNNQLTNLNQVNNQVNNPVNNSPAIINSPNHLPAILSTGERLINIATDFTVTPNNQDLRINLQNSLTNNPTNQLKTDSPVLQNLNTSAINLVSNSANINLVEMNRSQEFNNYFGQNLINENQPTRNIKEILNYIAEETGHQSAILYVNAYPQELQLVLYTPDGQTVFHTVPEAKRENLMRVVEEFKNNILDPKERNSQSYLGSAQQLYNWLIAPLQANLDTAQIDTILFSMDEGLRGIPLAALHDGKQFLIEKYSFSLIPSISLTDTTYRPMQNTQVLAMGASEFENLNDLPAVPIELSTITHQLWQGQDFLNKDFTLNNLIAQRQAYPYPIIHLATHAEFQPGLVNNSFIQLWDEKLRLDQVRQLGWSNPAVELLVLSACRTAVGDRNAELGFAGLAIATGVKSALASLWYVSDAGTLGLMTEFYVHLQNSSIKADALRKAQLAMLLGQVSIEGDQLRGSQERGGVILPPEIIARGGKTVNFTHPYYWSGFTMIGSPW